MPDINKLLIDPGEEELNTTRNILHDEEQKFYRQAISGPDADLCDSPIESEIDTLQHNHTWDIVDRASDRKIIDSKWVFKIKRLSDGSVDKFRCRLVAKRFSQIHGQGSDEPFALGLCFDSLCLLVSIVSANGFVPQQLDIKATFLYR
jgi:hypothetical protein